MRQCDCVRMTTSLMLFVRLRASHILATHQTAFDARPTDPRLHSLPEMVLHLPQTPSLIRFVTPPPVGKRSIVMSVSVCVFVCPRSYVRNDTSDLYECYYGRGSVLLWRRSDTLLTSGFIDSVISAHKPRLLGVAAQLKRSAHAALGLATKCAQ